MAKIKLIRCKTPHDIIVIKNSRDYGRIVQQLISAPSDWKCGHSHQIVSGDIWFARPKK